MNKLFNFSTIFFLSCSLLLSQYNENTFSVSANLNFTTTSKIFLSPYAETLIERNNNFNIEDIISYSADLRLGLTDFLIIGVSAEFISASELGRNLSSPIFIVEDGYKVYPLEFSLIYVLPFSTNKFKFYMGGGAGFYYGERTRKFGDVTFLNEGNNVSYGIHVNTGMDYMIFNFLSARIEFRFRDPEIKIKNKYSKTIVNYNGIEYQLPLGNIDSKVNIDGITFKAGLVFHF